ncbi:MAG TPA: hypothetical protein VMU93_12990 [Caulobacteraceae bacterium]|nr:hypothetical protein [Caulobacteraceae bacterium]
MGFLIAQIIPLFGIIMIICIVIGPIWISAYFRAKERAQLHETLRIAYEKGLPPPPELIEKLTAGGQAPTQSSALNADLRRGVVLVAVGLGLCGLGLGLGWGIGFADQTGGAITGGVVAGAGAIPGLIGVAYLLLWLGSRRTIKD